MNGTAMSYNSSTTQPWTPQTHDKPSRPTKRPSHTCPNHRASVPYLQFAGRSHKHTTPSENTRKPPNPSTKPDPSTGSQTRNFTALNDCLKTAHRTCTLAR